MGLVSLVGAGPGDPELLTLAAVRRLRDADVVYHDALVAPASLAHSRPDARRVSVGKRRGAPSADQREIESALIRDARRGLRVVRLKGGDPFVFGRGGEEALALARAGVPFEVVPGVSSGVAAPAAAGIPVTHRGLAGSAAFVTAHDLVSAEAGLINTNRLRHLAQGADTLVVFMAGAELARVKHALLDAGLATTTPAALIESGTTAHQRVVTGTLADLDSLGRGHAGGPVLLVIGRTVALADVIRGVATELNSTQPPAPIRAARAARRAG